MYSHKNCIIRMNTTTSRIAMNGPMNDFNMNWSSFFISAGERFYFVASSIMRARAAPRPSGLSAAATENQFCSIADVCSGIVSCLYKVS